MHLEKQAVLMAGLLFKTGAVEDGRKGVRTGVWPQHGSYCDTVCLVQAHNGGADAQIVQKPELHD